jgi:hypothetical protein
VVRLPLFTELPGETSEKGSSYALTVNLACKRSTK